MRIGPRALLVIAVALAIAVSGSTVHAGNKKPKGPKDKSRCEELKHATPGLYGLCIAFWIGQNCLPDFGADDPFENCTPGSARILENYRNLMGPTDPDMPGLQKPCPCWSNEILVNLVPPDSTHPAFCQDEFPGSYREVGLSYYHSRESFWANTWLVAYWSDGGETACFFQSLCGDDDEHCREIGFPQIDGPWIYGITREEAEACIDQIVDMARSFGARGNCTELQP